MEVANVATDDGSVFRYKRLMTETKKFRSAKPVSPMNQWVRDAVAHFGKTYDDLAEELNKQKLGTTYDKSKVQKMTVKRRVSMDEARAISLITQYPLGDEDEAEQFFDDFQKLENPDKEIVRDLVLRLRAAQDRPEQD